MSDELPEVELTEEERRMLRHLEYRLLLTERFGQPERDADGTASWVVSEALSDEEFARRIDERNLLSAAVQASMGGWTRARREKYLRERRAALAEGEAPSDRWFDVD